MGKKEKIAILTGFALIVFVLVFTFIRSLNLGKTDQNDASNDPGSGQATADYETISSKDLQKKIQTGENPVVVDIRSFDQFISEHIIDSINIPADEISSSDKLKSADKIFIVSADSDDSDPAKAVASLKNRGIAAVTVLAGGIAAWQASGGQTVSFGDPTSFVDQAKVFYVDAQKAGEMLKNDAEGTIALDVRDQSVFTQGHVPGALNIPLLELEKRRSEIPSFKKILIFGSSDVLAFQAGVQIHDLRQTGVYIVKGAMKAWEDAKLETVK